MATISDTLEKIEEIKRSKRSLEVLIELALSGGMLNLSEIMYDWYPE
ncbi:MAG: hypothetical protein ACXQTJ_03845 [Candidatus Syntropharchaeales archaeon]